MCNLRRLFVSMMLVSAAFGVEADDANAQKALAKAQFMLRQVTAEKAELQTQVDTLKQQIDKLTKDMASAKSASGSEKEKLEQKYGSAIEQLKAHGENLNGQLESVRAQLKRESTQRAQLEESLRKSGSNFSLCYGNNKKLYSINRDLLDRYQKKGFLDVVGQKEPFAGLKQVEVENLVQDYQYQLDDLKINNGNVDASNEPGGKVATP